MISQFKEICLKMKTNGHSDKVSQVLGSQSYSCVCGYLCAPININGHRGRGGGD